MYRAWSNKLNIIVAGGTGFICSKGIRYIIRNTDDSVISFDSLTYAENLESLVEVSDSESYVFERVNICDPAALEHAFRELQPDVVMHLAAEFHFDRSINGPAAFIETNIVGTYTLLEVFRQYWQCLGETCRAAFRIHHIPTDEVYGDLENPEALFTEITSYTPSSPNSASKAGFDQLVCAWRRTYDLPIGRGFPWFDTGAHESLLEASHFVEIIDTRQRYKIACLEEIAFCTGWMSAYELQHIGRALSKNGHDQYLLSLIK